MTFNLWGLEINWLAQIFGFISLVLMVYAYQQPRKRFLFFISLGAIFMIAEAAVLSGWTQVIRFVIALVRNFMVLGYLNRNREMPFFWIPTFIVITIIASVFFIDHWYAVLPIILSILVTIANCIKNYRATKILLIITETGTMVYCFLIGAYIGALRNFILAIAVAISLIRLLKSGKQAKFTQNIQAEPQPTAEANT
jgi:hypothetical protein